MNRPLTPEEIALVQQYAPQRGTANTLTPEEIALVQQQGPSADGTGITSGLAEIANEMEELNSQIDTAEEPVEIMNALRGKQASVEEYRMELAEMIGSKDAEKTPESVLTLIQPLLTAMEATQQSVPQSGIAQAPMQNVVYRKTGSPPGGEQAGSAGFFTESEIPVVPGDGRSNNLMTYLQMLQEQQPKPKTYQEYYDIYSQASPAPKTSAYDALGFQSLINLGANIASSPKGQLLSTVLDPQNMQRVSDPLLKMVMGKAQEEKARKASIAKSATEAKLKADEAYQESQASILKAGLPEVLKSMKPNEELYGSPEFGYFVYDKNKGSSRQLSPGKVKSTEKQEAFKQLKALQEQIKNVDFDDDQYATLKSQILSLSDIINPRKEFNTILDKTVADFREEVLKDNTISVEEAQKLTNEYEKDLIDKWLESQTSGTNYDPNKSMKDVFANRLDKIGADIDANASLASTLASLSLQAKAGSDTFKTGSFADTRLSIAKLLQIIPGGKEAFEKWAISKGQGKAVDALNDLIDPNKNLDDVVAAGELINTAGAQFAVYMADNFPGNLNQSEVDLIKTAGPKLSTSPQGLAVLAHIYTKASERAKAQNTFYNDYLSAEPGTKIPFAGKEYEVFSSPRQMVTTIRQANQDYVESTNMFDENKEIVDQELARLIGLMPQEGEVLAGGSLFNVPQLGPTGAISNFKMDPNEYNIMVELQKLKPELKSFIEQHNQAQTNPANAITINLDDPTSVPNTGWKGQTLTILGELMNNLNTPELDKFLEIQGKNLTPESFLSFMFTTRVNQ